VLKAHLDSRGAVSKFVESMFFTAYASTEADKCPLRLLGADHCPGTGQGRNPTRGAYGHIRFGSIDTLDELLHSVLEITRIPLHDVLTELGTIRFVRVGFACLKEM